MANLTAELPAYSSALRGKTAADGGSRLCAKRANTMGPDRADVLATPEAQCNAADIPGNP